VSNASLILGMAGAAPSPSVIVLTGIAGMLAGAFSMAAGEYISVRSQRELHEYQIGLEREELGQYPEEEAAELALIDEAKGIGADEARRLADALVADPVRALDALAREELGLNPGELGSPWGWRDFPSSRSRWAPSCRCCPSFSFRQTPRWSPRQRLRGSRCSASVPRSACSPVRPHGGVACGC
jgi:VIT1/CCC1 family predicted Fe2+/Mn2+ transporter